MKNIRIFIFILVILLTFGLTACTRSASQPSDSSGDEAKLPVPTMGTQEPMDILEEMATQTAMAMEAGASQPEADAGAGEAAPVDEGTSEETAAAEAGEEGAAVDAGTSGETEADVGGGQEDVFVLETYKVPDTYIVQKGDHLYCIARRFDINVAALLNKNGLSNDSNVYPGTKLVIPKDRGGFAGTRALRAHPTDYTVVAGDTINSIACLFGDVDPRAIEAANGLTGNYALTPGKLLDIP
jgi:LysM repeat protein